MMEAYSGFAPLYDVFMEETPYEDWELFLLEVLGERDINTGIVLDLGCGTGTMTELFARHGFEMIGVDNSFDMLQIAKNKAEESEADILYLQQDMREFELFGTVHAVISVCDSINYILKEEELLQVFCLVNNYLDLEGVFVFDFNTEYKYREVLGECVIAENREEGSFIWENFYYEEEKINEYELTLFLKDGDCFRKSYEIHHQRGYSLEEIKLLLTKAGLVFEEAYDNYTKEAPTEKSERICVIAREHGKSKAD